MVVRCTHSQDDSQTIVKTPTCEDEKSNEDSRYESQQCEGDTDSRSDDDPGSVVVVSQSREGCMLASWNAYLRFDYLHGTVANDVLMP